MAVEIVTVKDSEEGLRLDRFLKVRYPALGFGQLQKILRTGQVRVDGARAKPQQRLEAGQNVRVPPLGEAGKPGAPSTKKAAAGDEFKNAVAQALYNAIARFRGYLEETATP